MLGWPYHPKARISEKQLSHWLPLKKKEGWQKKKEKEKDGAIKDNQKHLFLYSKSKCKNEKEG